MRHVFSRADAAIWKPVQQFVAKHHPKIAVVTAQFNAHLTQQLKEGAIQALHDAGVSDSHIITAEVPGAFELPLLAQHLIKTADCQAVICLGVVIQGDTPHFEYVCHESARGILDVSLKTSCPVIFGVLTTLTQDQAEIRANPKKDNKGGYAALSALQTLLQLQ